MGISWMDRIRKSPVFNIAFEYIKKNPGCKFKDIMGFLDRKESSVIMHLSALIKDGKITMSGGIMTVNATFNVVSPVVVKPSKNNNKKSGDQPKIQTPPPPPVTTTINVETKRYPLKHPPFNNKTPNDSLVQEINKFKESCKKTVESIIMNGINDKKGDKDPVEDSKSPLSMIQFAKDNNFNMVIYNTKTQKVDMHKMSRISVESFIKMVSNGPSLPFQMMFVESTRAEVVHLNIVKFEDWTIHSGNTKISGITIYTE